jgi:hypothetical protein
MKFDLSAFSKSLVLLATFGVALGLVIGLVSPAHAFCGSLKRDPQPNYATADCK